MSTISTRLETQAASECLSISPDGKSPSDSSDRVSLDSLNNRDQFPNRVDSRPPDSAGALDGIFVLRSLDGTARDPEPPRRAPAVVVIRSQVMSGPRSRSDVSRRRLKVTVPEALPPTHGCGLGTEVGAVCGALPCDHGVDLRLGVSVKAIPRATETSKRLHARRRRGDRAVSSVVDIRRAAGDRLAGRQWAHDLRRVWSHDETCLAAPGVVIASDVARWRNPLFDEDSMRLEHWTNATEQSVAARDGFRR